MKTNFIKLGRQYKQEHPDQIVAIRLGDFYEFLDEDAVTTANALELTLTQRQVCNGSDERCFITGIPYHMVQDYKRQLESKGFNVALIDGRAY